MLKTWAEGLPFSFSNISSVTRSLSLSTHFASALAFVCGASTPYQLFRKPRHVPSAQTLDVFDHQLETAEIQGCHGVKGNVKEDESPLEEGIDGVCWKCRQSGSIGVELSSLTHLLVHGAPCVE